MNADFEGGFAVEPADVAANVARATATGIAGLSIEDSTGDAVAPAVRVRARGRADSRGAAAIDAAAPGAAHRPLGGVHRPDARILGETIRRLTAYAEAGADCLYAPGAPTREQIMRDGQGAVAPEPVNVLVGGDFTTVAELADLGVRRISVGGALARAAWGGFVAAAREIRDAGTFNHLSQAIPSADLQGLFDDEDDTGVRSRFSVLNPGSKIEI